MKAAPERISARDDRVLVEKLRRIVGSRHIFTRPSQTRKYSQGYRFGQGPVAAVVRPGSLVEQWRAVNACVDAGAIIIMQAANTGLTGGSTPNGIYDRSVVVINTMRVKRIHLIDAGRQVICLPGTTLYALEKILKPVGREPHSVIGSSCIGASVVGGVCNNSGGALVRRGPAFTQYALYARIDESGQVELINHLGIKLGDDPEAMLARLQSGSFTPSDIEFHPDRVASDQGYEQHVRDIGADTPARFNADPSRLFEASGSAGKLILFAVRLDTFPSEETSATFYIGTNATGELTELRRHILANFASLPVSAEYVHRTAYDIAAIYGKDTFLAIQHLGTDRLPMLYALKSWMDAMASRFAFLKPGFSDRLLQRISTLFPQHLPSRMTAFRDRYCHHLMLKMSGDGIGEVRRYLSSIFPSAEGDYFECTAEEGAKAFLHRFAVAGAAVRYRAVHHESVEDIVALDIALPRNDKDWFETLPDEMATAIIHKIYYGHFLCHVFHQDYIISKGHDPIAIEHQMLSLLDQRGAEYPAEHNVGHLYKGKPELVRFYRGLDPTNQLNPGVGKTSRQRNWA